MIKSFRVMRKRVKRFAKKNPAVVGIVLVVTLSFVVLAATLDALGAVRHLDFEKRVSLFGAVVAFFAMVVPALTFAFGLSRKKR